MSAISPRKFWIVGLLMAVGVIAGCESAGNEPSPVELVATIEDKILILDFADAQCPDQLAAVSLRAIIKRPELVADPSFLDVIVKAYRVSYRRLDGGTLVPRSFVRRTSILVPATGAATEVSNLLAFEALATSEAPFISLFTNNGLDPETNLPTVKLEIITEYFGETLSGEEVNARTSQTVTFCNGCGGCVPRGQ